MYIPAAKAAKAYKFARPFHSTYKIIEQSDTGATVCPKDKPQTEPIRMAYNRIRYCCLIHFGQLELKVIQDHSK